MQNIWEWDAWEFQYWHGVLLDNGTVEKIHRHTQDCLDEFQAVHMSEHTPAGLELGFKDFKSSMQVLRFLYSVDDFSLFPTSRAKVITLAFAASRSADIRLQYC